MTWNWACRPATRRCRYDFGMVSERSDRVQDQQDFADTLHVLMGLFDLGQVEEARQYLLSEVIRYTQLWNAQSDEQQGARR